LRARHTKFPNYEQAVKVTRSFQWKGAFGAKDSCVFRVKITSKAGSKIALRIDFATVPKFSPNGSRLSVYIMPKRLPGGDIGA
jgi:hypothetical protein